MKASSLSELQKELTTLPPKRIIEIAVRLARYKKENKELLTYLLFESENEEHYVSGIKREVDDQFAAMNTANLYLAKKSLRKILRLINKYIKYSGSKLTELEIRLYYCSAFRKSGIRFQKSPVLLNIYSGQLKKIHAALAKLHEDVQFDFAKDVAAAEDI
jgi:hypothetical protein